MYQLYLFDFYYFRVLVVLLAFILIYLPLLEAFFKANFLTIQFPFLPCFKFRLARFFEIYLKFLLRFPLYFRRLFRYFKRDFRLTDLAYVHCEKTMKADYFVALA